MTLITANLPSLLEKPNQNCSRISLIILPHTGTRTTTAPTRIMTRTAGNPHSNLICDIALAPRLLHEPTHIYTTAALDSTPLPPHWTIPNTQINPLPITPATADLDAHPAQNPQYPINSLKQFAHTATPPDPCSRLVQICPLFIQWYQKHDTVMALKIHHPENCRKAATLYASTCNKDTMHSNDMTQKLHNVEFKNYHTTSDMTPSLTSVSDHSPVWYAKHILLMSTQQLSIFCTLWWCHICFCRLPDDVDFFWHSQLHAAHTPTYDLPLIHHQNLSLTTPIHSSDMLATPWLNPQKKYISWHQLVCHIQNQKDSLQPP